MSSPYFSLTSADIDFLAQAATPELKDRHSLKQLLETDSDFRAAFLEHEGVARLVTREKDVFVRISPHLYFEILLRLARRDLEGVSYTLERAGMDKVAVFDADRVVEFLSHDNILFYLADLLASFTRVESYTLVYRRRSGIWRKFRFSDLDLASLLGLCEQTDEEQRLGFYKRIADICLFVLGVFPEFVELSHRYPLSGEMRPQFAGHLRWGPADYQEQGKKFYRLAAEHPRARLYELSETFQT
ncbi:MAG: hypothetical protein JRI59_04880, partial [Deltaproteobacteria bacterium]|nr:hypothetical protein [Deltaproteobacteria bacterium]